MFRNGLSLLALLAIISPFQIVLGDLVVNNHCRKDVTVVLSQNGGCDKGPDGCTRDGSEPWKLGGNKKKSVWRHAWQGDAVSVKIGKKGKDGILQYEYSHNGAGLWWNLSDLDGKGPGLVGTPFRSDRVGITPSGEGSGQGNCVKIRCKPDENPDDPKTRYCPKNTGDMTLDLCMPKLEFSRNFP
ncbi:hypothetical protein NLU13_0137 [Sarocladium strictum]|uniref:Secreted protein n=1 Tax=Sarocladium strictum TaxID=5046 RepID=A0AA39LB06_SARSR|nr:hypothetical protein NLU13_0137 [Sarocladium strictum]